MSATADHNATAPEADRGPDQAATRTAVVQDGYGPPHDVLRLEELPLPPVGDDEVLIRVKATSVNTPDWAAVIGEPYILRAGLGFRGPSTPVRGTDVAGIVEEVGAGVTDFQPGDEVFGAIPDATRRSRPAGTFATHTVGPASRLIPKPADVSFEAAAGSVMSGLTALIAMRDVAQVEPGNRVLINGASGGVGLLAVQVAKAYGAEVTGVCSAANVDLVRSVGADEVIDYTVDDFTQGDGRYDVILDNVMNHWPSATARALAPGGMLIPNSLGITGGLFAGLLRMGWAAVRGTLLRRVATGYVHCEVTPENLHALASLLTSEQVRVIIDATYPLAEAADAVAHMLSHRARGKVIITA